MDENRKRYFSYKAAVFTGASFVAYVLILFAFSYYAVREKVGIPLVAGGYIVLFLLIYIYYHYIYVPYKEKRKVLKAFLRGDTFHGVFDYPFHFSPELDQAMKKMKGMLDTNELISASKKQAEYLALQNQINPHFLYNTLEGIRSEALNAGLVHTAKMTEALATFFRYTISNVEHLVTVEDELKNIDDYCLIQQYRFGDKLHLSVEYNEEEEEQIMNCKLPKLTLQPVVENSIYHGIERKVGRGNLRIKMEVTEKRLILTISDDGLGMKRERLRELNRKLQNLSMDYVKPDTESKGGIAVINVNSRIKLLFGEEYGITIYSVENSGTDVEITLPLVERG